MLGVPFSVGVRLGNCMCRMTYLLYDSYTYNCCFVMVDILVAFLFFVIPIVYDSVVLLVYLSIDMNKNRASRIKCQKFSCAVSGCTRIISVLLIKTYVFIKKKSTLFNKIKIKNLLLSQKKKKSALYIYVRFVICFKRINYLLQTKY